MKRRAFLIGASSKAITSPAVADTTYEFEICLTDAEWRARLTDAEYRVLREEDTEHPYSSALNDETRPGQYLCRGCLLPVYSSETKYDSGTGWPSFWDSLPGAVGTREDRRFIFQIRTEVHCRRCGGHLGHIFTDGPEPTEERHCLNGISLTFAPTV
ncbi:MAG: peptide-methionine (R)-S-oxide reductase MsrB [Pseudomonadota bacterium]